LAFLTEISGAASPDDAPNGEIIITAVSGPILTNIVISPLNPTIAIGTNKAFAATGYFADGSVRLLALTNGLVWNSSNSSVATIDTNGVATSLSGGTATISATEGSISGYTTLTVLFPPHNQTNIYLFTGSETNVTLNPGLYEITAYGAQGGQPYTVFFYGGGGVFAGGASLGAEMKAEFNFTTRTTLTLLIGGAGYNGGDISPVAGGGGGGSFVVNGSTPLVIAGGGGGGGGGNGGGGSGYNGNVGTGGGNGAGGYPGYGGSGGSAGSGGSYPSDSYTSAMSGGGGGGGFSGDGSGEGFGSLGGLDGSSFLDGGAGGAGNDPINGVYGSGDGGYGGGGGGGIPLEDDDGFGGGGGGGYSGGGGGSGEDDTYIGAGGGGGSIIDSSAVAILAESSGVASPDNSPNGEIIITTIEPITLASSSIQSNHFSFNINGVNNEVVVVEACTNLANQVWNPISTNSLTNGLYHFSDPQQTGYPVRYYRVHSQ
jgi:hypothetical protein